GVAAANAGVLAGRVSRWAGSAAGFEPFFPGARYPSDRNASIVASSGVADGLAAADDEAAGEVTGRRRAIQKVTPATAKTSAATPAPFPHPGRRSACAGVAGAGSVGGDGTEAGSAWAGSQPASSTAWSTRASVSRVRSRRS